MKSFALMVVGKLLGLSVSKKVITVLLTAVAHRVFGDSPEMQSAIVEIGLSVLAGLAMADWGKGDVVSPSGFKALMLGILTSLRNLAASRKLIAGVITLVVARWVGAPHLETVANLGAALILGLGAVDFGKNKTEELTPSMRPPKYFEKIPEGGVRQVDDPEVPGSKMMK